MTNDVVYSISGGAGEVWVGRQRGGLTRLRVQGDAITADTFTQADGLSQNNVYAVHRARDGTVWAGTLSGGVSRFKDGRFTTFTTADGLASNTVTAIAESADGAVWLATPNGVSVEWNGGWRRYAVGDGLPSNDVNTVFEDSARNVWVGTAAGLAVVRNGRVWTTFHVPPQLRASIVGLAEDGAGSLWIATADHVLQVTRNELLSDSPVAAAVREYGAADGLLGIEGVKRHRSLIADLLGRIWIGTSVGLSMTDPIQAGRRSASALVHLEALSADGSLIATRGAVNIPPRPQRIAFSFTGLSLSVPERIMFRYRLDGFDRDWSEPVRVRQAVYTNLGPGTYQFRVIASNSDGTWNGSEATLRLSIKPAFWQTTWFRA